MTVHQLRRLGARQGHDVYWLGGSWHHLSPGIDGLRRDEPLPYWVGAEERYAWAYVLEQVGLVQRTDEDKLISKEDA
jgi:hypothetical protein